MNHGTTPPETAPDPPQQPETPESRRAALLDILATKGLLELDEPVRLSSGAMSRYFLDGKRALARGADLALACRCLVDVAARAGIEFDACGGLTLGADQFAHGVAIVADKEWFVVRKQPKGRGTDRYVEGASLDGKRVLLVDDVITTGGSSMIAKERIEAEGGLVVLASTLVARSDEPARTFAAAGVPFIPLATYIDLGIPAVGTEVPA
jgi:orotate phosphoribosyltransferase